MKKNNHLKKIVLILMLCVGITYQLHSQVGVGTNQPEDSSILDVSSNTKGLLTPRMTAAQRTAISSPANGLIVYQTDGIAGFYYYNGTTWARLINTNESAEWINVARPSLLLNKSNVMLLANDTIMQRTNEGALRVYTDNSNRVSNHEFWGSRTGTALGGWSRLSINSVNAPVSFRFSRNYTNGAQSPFVFTNPIVGGIVGGIESLANYNVAGVNYSRILGSIETRIGQTITGSIPTADIYFRIVNNSSPTNSALDMPPVMAMNGNNQNVGVNVTTPHSSAQFEVNSTNKGFLPPRMTFEQIGTIANPAEGLIAYCTNCTPKGLRIFDGTDWADASGVVPQKATFTFTGNNTIQSLNFSQGQLTSNAFIDVEIAVTTPGVITFSSNAPNGYSFYRMFNATSATVQLIRLTANGTLNTFNASGDNITITGVGASSQTQNVVVQNTQNGASFATYSNGGTFNQTFNTNTLCLNKAISASHTSSTCPSTLTVGSNTYNLVLINGQCWMAENLREPATTPCGSAINTGCNVWVNVSPPDNGYWGFYNTTTTSGSAGWRTTVPAAGEGLLFQWSAAMNGATHERAQGVCPAGWHIPSDCEWMYLEHGQGMSIEQQLGTNWRGGTQNESHKLRVSGTGATNTSGFSALLPGFRNSNGVFQERGTVQWWWASTDGNSSQAFRRGVQSNDARVLRDITSKPRGISVRCVKD